MLRLLFWNLNRQPLHAELSQLAFSNRIDFLVLAEDTLSQGARLASLNDHETRYFATASACERIDIYTAFSDQFIRLRRESKYYSFREVFLPTRASFSLVAVHWKSNMWRSPQSQTSALTSLAGLIREHEVECGHRRTIVVGDFNADPFSDGMRGANGFHAVMCRKVAARMEREVSPFGEFPFFYNPMWSAFGDENEGPPGTYYRSTSEDVCQYWHLFDQILVRPELLSNLPRRSVRIPTSTGEHSLIDQSGHPHASDHLPLIFEFELPDSLTGAE